MNVCPPALTGGALYVAFILYDVTQSEYRRIPGRLFSGVLSVLLLNYLCQKGATTLSWVLLGFPILLALLGALFRPSYSPKRTDSGSSDSDCPCCHYRPCGCPRPCPVPVPVPVPVPPSPPKPSPPNCVKLSD
jgi:hypothetical protein